jgi:hypothetical protein
MTPVKLNLCNCGSWTSSWECPHNVFDTVECNDNGVFVKSGLKFIVTDDLQVTAASTTLVFSLLDRFGLQEQAKIEEKIFQLSPYKVCIYNCVPIFLIISVYFIKTQIIYFVKDFFNKRGYKASPVSSDAFSWKLKYIC